MSEGRIYVGNLPMDVQERDIEDLFYKYGKIREIELKNNRGTIPFAFIRFEDPRDADDAVYGRNGYGYGDSKLRVEYPRSSSKFNPMGGGGGGGDRGSGPRGRFGPPTRRSEFRVIVTGRWTSTWTIRKWTCRVSGVSCPPMADDSIKGLVVRSQELQGSTRKIGAHIHSCPRLQGETAYIHVYEDRGTPNWGRSRSRSRSRGRFSPPYRGSPPPRYQSPPRMSRHSPPRRSSNHSPPPRHYR
uniref:Serine and arginine rich splicing factor 9 n=1 Tax=Hippocampus comes TaxID=109280 RepID=A0A3Q2ZJ27_HIPCM